MVGRGADPVALVALRDLSRDRISLTSSIRLSGGRDLRVSSIHLSMVDMGRGRRLLRLLRGSRGSRDSRSRVLRADSLHRMSRAWMLMGILPGLRAGATRK